MEASNKAKAKKPDKYDITVKLDCTFEEAMKKVATHPNTKKQAEKKSENKI